MPNGQTAQSAETLNLIRKNLTAGRKELRREIYPAQAEESALIKPFASNRVTPKSVSAIGSLVDSHEARLDRVVDQTGNIVNIEPLHQLSTV